MRVLKQPLVVTLYVALIVGLIAFSFIYASRMASHSNYHAPGIMVSSYDDVSEIPSRIDHLTFAKKSLDPDEFQYERMLDIYGSAILMYEYLYANELEYEDYAQPSMLQGYQDNPVRYMQFLMEALLTGIIFFVLVLALSFVNYEHATGVYKFIYGTEEPRLSIIKRKLFAYGAHVLLILVIVISILAIFGNALDQPFDWLILVWNDRVYGFETCTYARLIIASLILVVIFFSIVFFALALLSRNIFMALVLCIVFVGLFQGVFFHLDYRYLQAFAQFPVGIFIIDVSVAEAIVIYIIRYVALFLLLTVSLIHFNRKELY